MAYHVIHYPIIVKHARQAPPHVVSIAPSEAFFRCFAPYRSHSVQVLTGPPGGIHGRHPSMPLIRGVIDTPSRCVMRQVALMTRTFVC